MVAARGLHCRCGSQWCFFALKAAEGAALRWWQLAGCAAAVAAKGAALQGLYAMWLHQWCGSRSRRSCRSR